MPQRLGGVLLTGKSGSGKSDLALRLIDQFKARLVADDQVHVVVSRGHVVASAPKALRNMLEVRGVGIVHLPVKPRSAIALVVQLVENPKDVERLPHPQEHVIHDVKLPLIKLYAFEISAANKIHAALDSLRRSAMQTGAFTE
jgi:serine kinase of HPr protein (carbohydrate metabolism regulator)